MRFNTATLIAVVALGYVLCAAAMPHESPISHAAIDAMYEPTTEMLPDGRTRIEHSYHYTHPEHGTFVKKTLSAVAATHKYDMVTVDGQADAVHFSPANAEGVSVVTIVAPSAGLRAQLVSRTKRVVIVGSAFADDQGRPLMHHVVSQESTTTTTVVIQVSAASYDQLFEDLALAYGTNHLTHQGESVRTTVDASFPEGGIGSAASPREFGVQQFGWLTEAYDSVKKSFQLSDIIASVKDTVKGLGIELLQAGRVLLQSGELVLDRTYALGRASFNRKVNDASFENVTAKYQVAARGVDFGASALVELSMNLVVRVQAYRFQNHSLSFTGTYSAEILFRALPALGANATEEKLNLADLKLNAINFNLFGKLAVRLSAALPITAGYAVTGDSAMSVDTAWSSTGRLFIGYVLDNTVKADPRARMFRTFARPDFKYTGHVAGEVDGDMIATAYIQPALTVVISFIGGASATLRISGEAIFRRNRTEGAECPVLVTLVVQPVFTITANAELTAMSVVGNLLKKSVYGPEDLYNTQIQVFRVCSQVAELNGRAFSPSSAQYEPSPMDVASVFSTARGACDGARQMSLQVDAVRGTEMTMIMNMEHHAEEAVFTAQQKFRVERRDRQLTFTHVPSAMDYQNDATQALTKAFEGEMSADGDSLVLRKIGACGDVTVRRPALKHATRNTSARRLPATTVGAIAAGACLVAIAVASALIVRRRRVAQAEAELLEATA